MLTNNVIVKHGIDTPLLFLFTPNKKNLIQNKKQELFTNLRGLIGLTREHNSKLLKNPTAQHYFTKMIT